MRFRNTRTTQQLAVWNNIHLLNGVQIMLLISPEALHKDWPKAERLPCSSTAFLKLWSADHKWSSGSALVVLLD